MTRFRFIATGDNHFDQHSRFDETIRVHGWIADLVERERPDVFLCGGDIYERASTPIERAAVVAWVSIIADVCPVVITKGNHDKARDLEILAHLATRHPIVVEETCGVHFVAGAAIAAMAWPSRASLMAYGGGESRADVNEDASTALRNVLRQMGTELEAHNGPRILLGHLMIDGSVTSSGQPMIGETMNVPLEDVALAKAEISIAAHIHLPQAWEHDGRPILYTGSPTRNTFGELEEKSIVLGTFEGSRLVLWERIPTPTTPMVHADAVVDGENGTISLVETDPPLDVVGAEVRLRYRVPADCQEMGKRLVSDLKAKLIGYGAVSVETEPDVIAITRARAPEVALAKSLEDKLGAYWEAKNDVPDLDRSLRLIAKIRQVDDAVPQSSGAGAPGRFLAIRAKNMRPFSDVEVDLTEIPGPLVAITGDNGAGKSAFLEMFTGSYFRTTPKHGSLVHMATSRSSLLEVKTWNGAGYTLRHLIDNVSKKSDALVLDADGKPLIDAAKATEFKAWAERYLPSREVLEASTFAVQGKGGFLELGAAERKSVFLKAIGIERIELVAKVARESGEAAKGAVREAEVRRDEALGRATPVEEAEATLALAERDADGCKGVLAAANTCVREAERAAEAHQRSREERNGIQSQVETLDREVLGAIRRKMAAQDLAARAPEIVKAREDVARLEVELEAARGGLVEWKTAVATVEKDVAEAAKRTADRRDLQDRILVLSADLDEAKANLAAQEGLASRASEIEAARLAAVDLDAHVSKLRTQVDTIRRALSGAEHGDAEGARALQALRSELAAKEAEIRRLDAVLANEAEVLAAVARLDGELAEIGTLRAERTTLDERLTATRAALLTSKDDRILGLRDGLAAIAGGDPASAEKVATVALDRDDVSAVAAGNAPDAIRADERALVELSGRIDAADRRAEATSRLADRHPTMVQARVEHGVALARVDALLVETDAASKASTERAAELASLRGQIATLEAEVRTTESDLAEQRRIASDSESVGRAQAHVEALTRDVSRIEGEREQAKARLADLPSLAPVDATSVRESLRRAEQEEGFLVADIERAKRILVDADAVARASSEAETAERERARDEATIADLKKKLASIEAAPPADVDGAILRAEEAHHADRAAQAAVAKARAGLDMARESSARVATLQADVDAALAELSDWTRLAADLGKDGLQAIEVDAAGPELAAIANDLLHSCVSCRWTIDVRTQRQSADGKKTLEDCEIMVLDTQEGREADGSEFSGGEKVLIGEAISLALSLFACRRLGVQGPTLVRDESGAALSPENGRRYIEMLRRAAATIGADRILYVSHTPELQALADGRIHVGDGTAKVVPVDFEPSRSRPSARDDIRLAEAAE